MSVIHVRQHIYIFLRLLHQASPFLGVSGGDLVMQLFSGAFASPRCWPQRDLPLTAGRSEGMRTRFVPARPRQTTLHQKSGSAPERQVFLHTPFSRCRIVDGGAHLPHICIYRGWKFGDFFIWSLLPLVENYAACVSPLDAENAGSSLMDAQRIFSDGWICWGLFLYSMTHKPFVLSGMILILRA